MPRVPSHTVKSDPENGGGTKGKHCSSDQENQTHNEPDWVKSTPSVAISRVTICNEKSTRNLYESDRSDKPSRDVVAPLWRHFNEAEVCTKPHDEVEDCNANEFDGFHVFTSPTQVTNNCLQLKGLPK
jgi:hypothetical protein